MDPVTAITAAQTAISVVRLLQGGSDSGALAQLQVEMLKAISAQLSNIATGIKTIIERIDQLESLVLGAPKETVLQIYKAKILGAQGRYVQLMQTYQKDLATAGISEAQRLNAPLIVESVVSDLNEAITEITAYTSATAIAPVVASAAFIHVHAAIMSNQRGGLVIPQLETYVDWLAHATSPDNPASIVVSLQSVRSELSTAITAMLSLPTSYACNDQIQVMPMPLDDYTMELQWVPKKFRQVITLDSFSGELGKALADYNEAAGANVELSTGNLNQFTVSIGRPERGGFRVGEPSHAALLSTTCNAATVSQFDETRMRAIAGNITRLSVQCLLLASWELSANTALAFLRDKIEKFRSMPDAIE